MLNSSIISFFVESTDQFLYDTGWTLSQEKIHCSFGSTKCHLDEDFKISLTEFGKCYTFDPRQRFQTVPGRSGGLKLYVYNNKSDTLPIALIRDTRQMLGLKIIVHEPFEPPVWLSGLAVSPSFEMNVAVKKTVIKTFNRSPWKQCSEERLPIYNKYSMSGCLALCRSETDTRRCGCRPWYLPETNRSKVCSLSETLLCYFWIIGNSDSENCQRQCLENCEDVHFSYQPSYAALTSLPLMVRNGDNEVEETTENWLCVKVFFGDFSVDTLESSIAYPEEALLADLGNFMSMFIGFSVVTMFDFLEYPILKIYRQCIRPVLRKERIKKKRRQLRKQRNHLAISETHFQRKDDPNVIQTQIEKRMADVMAKRVLEKRRLALASSFVKAKFQRREAPKLITSSLSTFNKPK